MLARPWPVEIGKTYGFDMRPITLEESRQFNLLGGDQNLIHHQPSSVRHIWRLMGFSTFLWGKGQVIVSGAHLMARVGGILVQRFGHGVAVKQLLNFEFQRPLFTSIQAYVVLLPKEITQHGQLRLDAFISLKDDGLSSIAVGTAEMDRFPIRERPPYMRKVLSQKVSA